MTETAQPSPTAKTRRSTGRRFILPVLLALLLVAMVVFMPALFNAVYPSISKGQWRDVPTGATRSQVLDRLGTSARTGGYTSSSSAQYIYRGDHYSIGLPAPSRAQATASFNFDSRRRLEMKQWIEKHADRAISPSDYRSIRRGMSQSQVERRAGGAPHVVVDVVVRRGSFVVGWPSGRTRCWEYSAQSGTRDARLCFNARTDRLVYKGRVARP